ncbi:hypothetical protein J22TS3_22600 [Paenibacillus sp. J22TS3]|nr:hypothetical protein J22TS3_22600 [Paenibacillus sp. J22TS3]
MYGVKDKKLFEIAIKGDYNVGIETFQFLKRLLIHKSQLFY